MRHRAAPCPLGLLLGSDAHLSSHPHRTPVASTLGKSSPALGSLPPQASPLTLPGSLSLAVMATPGPIRWAHGTGAPPLAAVRVHHTHCRPQ